MPVSGAIEFLGGFLQGFVGDNHLSAIQTCVTDADTLATESIQVVEDFLNGEAVDALTELVTVYGQLSSDLADCKAVTTDVAAIKDWATMFSDKTTLIATVSKNFLLHRKAITADIQAEKEEWAAGQYYQAGLTAADAATLAFGPIEKAQSSLAIDVMAIPDFVAGFIYGMTGDNDLTEIEACFQGTQEMYNEITTGIADIEKGGWDNITQGVLYFAIALLEIPDALKTCENMDEDITAIEQWFSVFKDPSSLAADVSKALLFHKNQVMADASAIEADWEATNYFQSGVDLADLMTLVLGPIESSLI